MGVAMKTIAKMAAMLMLVALTQPMYVHGRKLTITWHYGGSQVASWRSAGVNMWGGYDYSCSGILNGCAMYDWMTNYYYSVQPPTLPPAAVSPDYPNAPRIAIMLQDGQTPPSNLPEPEVTQTFED
jgi:hypothetical protein